MSLSAFIYRIPETADSHYHDYSQLVVGIKGQSIIKIENEEMNVNRVNGCIIPSGTAHLFSGMDNNKSLTINIDHRFSSDTAKHICEKPRSFSMDRSMQMFMEFASMELPEYEESMDFGHDPFGEHIIAVFTDLLNNKIFHHRSINSRIDIDSIETYLNTRLHQKIGVNQLASHTGISPSHFFSIFKEEIGMTPHQYIVEKRLKKTMSLLKTTDLTISDISYETGFSSQSALNNSFKKYFGITPGSVKRLKS